LEKSLKLPDKVLDAIEKLRKTKDRLGIEEAYLTGSYARGDWLEESDLDLIIVSRKFQNKHIGERHRIIKETIGKGISLEAICYTPEEFSEAKKRSTILRDMLQYAHRII